MFAFSDGRIDARFRVDGARRINILLSERNHQLAIAIMNEKGFSNLEDAINWIFEELGDKY